MFDKMKQLMEMKKQADRMKKDLEALVVEVDEGRGVKIVLNGAQKFQSIAVDEAFLDPGRKADLERALCETANAAVKKIQTLAAQKMSSLLPELS